MFLVKQTMSELLYARKCLKCLKIPQKRNLERNVKHMTNVFDFNHLNTVIYSKWCLVISFLQNKPHFKHFVLESAKKIKKNLTNAS